MYILRESATITHNSHQRADNDDSKREECYECIGMDVWVSLLENLHQKQATNDEHKGSI